VSNVIEDQRQWQVEQLFAQLEAKKNECFQILHFLEGLKSAKASDDVADVQKAVADYLRG
jgi:hypothetical protein